MRLANGTNAVLTQLGIAFQGYVYALEAFAIMEGAAGVKTATLRPLAAKAPARRDQVAELLDALAQCPADEKDTRTLRETFARLSASQDAVLRSAGRARVAAAEELAALCREVKPTLSRHAAPA